MKKSLLGTVLLALVHVFPLPVMAGVDVGINISLPPPIVFSTPPEVVVIPETYVYVVPDVAMEIFFYRGWWWRLWEGHWYRSRHYDSSWVFYQGAPSFYSRIPSSWRDDYRDHRWRGHQWNYQRIPHQRLQRNWSNWEKRRYWEQQRTWGVQGLKPQTRSQQPPKAVQSKSPAKPQVKETAKPQPARPQPQTIKPQVKEAAKPQPARPQSGEVHPQHPQPQHREAPQKSEPLHEKHEGAGEEKQGGK